MLWIEQFLPMISVNRTFKQAVWRKDVQDEYAKQSTESGKVRLGRLYMCTSEAIYSRPKA